MPDKTRFRRRSLRLSRPVLLSALLALTAGVFLPSQMDASMVDVEVRATGITEFLTGSSQNHFGRLEFLGGLILQSPEPLFGAISGFRVRPDGQNFVAVLDTGHWLTGTIERGEAGRLSGLSRVKIDAMLDRGGRPAEEKVDMDAEGLALRNGQAFVSFEQFHRIEIFPDTGFETARPKGRLPQLIPAGELRSNGGMEMLAASPQTSPLKGALMTVAETSIDENGNLFAAILDGPLKGLLSVRQTDSFAVTDGAFLPSGDLLLLERRFNFAQGVGMRIRLIAGDTIKPGAVLDGEILIEAGLSYQIDNMEGIDVVIGPDGSTRIILVSDNNHSFLQRNLMLEFRLND